MFTILNPIKKTTVQRIQKFRMSNENPYLTFYYQRDHLGRLIKDKEKYNDIQSRKVTKQSNILWSKRKYSQLQKKGQSMFGRKTKNIIKKLYTKEEQEIAQKRIEGNIESRKNYLQKLSTTLRDNDKRRQKFKLPNFNQYLVNINKKTKIQEQGMRSLTDRDRTRRFAAQSVQRTRQGSNLGSNPVNMSHDLYPSKIIKDILKQRQSLFQNEQQQSIEVRIQPGTEIFSQKYLQEQQRINSVDFKPNYAKDLQDKQMKQGTNLKLVDSINRKKKQLSPEVGTYNLSKRNILERSTNCIIMRQHAVSQKQIAKNARIKYLKDIELEKLKVIVYKRGLERQRQNKQLIRNQNRRQKNAGHQVQRKKAPKSERTKKHEKENPKLFPDEFLIKFGEQFENQVKQNRLKLREIKVLLKKTQLQ